jgi:hypothetical protein
MLDTHKGFYFKKLMIIHEIDAVRFGCLAKVMVNRKRMVKVGRG